MLAHYGIDKVERPPFKFLGGIVKYNSEDNSSLEIDYTHHMEKVQTIATQGKHQGDEFVDRRTHSAFRTQHGILNYLVTQGYPL